jgi:hypothetical protein
MRSRSFALLLSLLAVGFLVVPGRSADKPSPEELKSQVKKLVEQLADKDPDKQDNAVADLLKIGPDALPFLPRADAKLPDSQKKALALVRKTLRDDQLKRDLSPKMVTLDGEYTVSKALAELKKQTDIEVEDKREGEDSKLKLNLKNVTFWQAMDAIARDADGLVNYYNSKGEISLMPRPERYSNPPVSYDGIFRTTIRRITAMRNFGNEATVYTATLEIAWEPRFRPFRLDLNPTDLTVQDEKGRKLIPDEEDREKTPLAVNAPLFVTFDVPLPAADRASAKLGLLKGTFKMVGPTRMDSFAFTHNLAEMLKDPKKRELVQDGVTVKVRELDLVKDHWTLVMGLEYPAGGPEFESFESWLVYNQIVLKNAAGKTYTNNGGYSIDSSAGNRAVLSYHFVDEKGKGLVRGEPGDWSIVYKTPGLIVEVPVNVEFKGIQLP